jgi:Tfp pilus assembly protein PilF
VKSYRLAFGLVLFFLLSFSAQVAAKDKWINLQSKNFNVVSNAGEEETREVLLKLEQFRFAFSKIFKAQNTVPITVMVFKSDGAFKPFKPLYNGKPANVSGYFQRTTDEDLIAMNIDARSEEYPLKLIFHEYVHYLTSRTPRRWPIWLTEGIAELYSTFMVKKNQVTLGAPISNHVFYLRDQKMIPLKDLFNVTHDSPAYNERDKQGVFYAQSWALTHYLMLGDRMARQPQMSQYVKLINEGVSPEAAFNQSFKFDMPTTEKSLRDYVGRNSYTVINLTLDSVEGEKDVTLRPLSDAEVQYFLGNLLLRTNRVDEGETYFKQAIALDGNFAGPYEGLGFAAIRKNQYRESKDYFKQAVERGSKNYLTHFYYAQELYNQSLAGATRETQSDAYKTVVEALITSIKLMPTYAYSRALLAHLYSRDTEKLNLAVQEMRTAIQLEPQQQEFRFNLAHIQMQALDFAGARKTLEPLLASDDAQRKKSAQHLMAVIDEQEKFMARAKESPTSIAPIREPSSGGRVYEETPQQKVLISPRVQEIIAQAERLSGVITAIECKNNSMVLTLKAGDKTGRFFVADYDKIPMFSRKGFYDVQFVCGPNKIPATIYFKPSADKKLSGEALVIEFLP